jgi:hypothetical protein
MLNPQKNGVGKSRNYVTKNVLTYAGSVLGIIRFIPIEPWVIRIKLKPMNSNNCLL